LYIGNFNLKQIILINLNSNDNGLELYKIGQYHFKFHITIPVIQFYDNCEKIFEKHYYFVNLQQKQPFIKEFYKILMLFKKSYIQYLKDNDLFLKSEFFDDENDDDNDDEENNDEDNNNSNNNRNKNTNNNNNNINNNIANNKDDDDDFFNDKNNEDQELIKENEKVQSFINPRDIVENYKKEKDKNITISENEYYERFLKHCLYNRIENLLCNEICEEIIHISDYYQNNFDKDWTKQGRRFFVCFFH
jgi:hypothetical protein